MSYQDWHVGNDSQCHPLFPPDQADAAPEKPQVSPYRVYRLLTDLEDILRAEADNTQRLAQIRPLVRHFLDESPLMLLQCPPPDPDRGWAVTKLYDEADFPLTIQLVSWKPGMVSSIHNHAAWGLVAILDGEECNRFWQPQAEGEPMAQVGEQTLQPGELITFMPDAIHQIEALGPDPVLSFNLYGETQYDQRFEYTAADSRSQPF
ncbi:MAG: cupin [Synechococcales cyanobacterium RM1_1_8]|nr:cupin [Synechococcales cyanobacterium RM1_1_8]